MEKLISVNEPLIQPREKKYVNDCLDTGWISSAGKYIDEFEKKWALYCGRKYGIAVCNGTVALELSLAPFNFKKGDEVIMPTFTIISCALAVIRNQALPILVDCTPDTWTMDVSDIEKKITKHTKAIMAVHIYGHPVDMDPVLEIAEKYNLIVIEDAAEAHGAEYLQNRNLKNKNWKKCGSFGDASIFSFYANKPITTGEGGMILTDDNNLAEKYRSMRNLCFLPVRRFYHTGTGYNFRITNLQAAMGVAQIERFSEIVKKKRLIGQQYSKRLKDISILQLPVEMSWAKSIYWMYGIVISEKAHFNAKDLADKLIQKGIETRPFFLGMHQEPVFKEMNLFRREKYPVAERIAKYGLYLPSGLTLTLEQIDYISDVLHKELK